MRADAAPALQARTRRAARPAVRGAEPRINESDSMGTKS